MNELEALKLDEEDELRVFRNEFLIPRHGDGQECVYLAGNSLGLQPKSVSKYIDSQLHKWASQAVEGHFTEPTPWLTIDDTVQSSMASLVGALPSEVVLMNSLTSNLHLMMVAFYRPTPERFKVLIEKKAFPSDVHAVVSQIRFHGVSPEEALLELSARENETFLRTEDIEKVLFY